MNRRPQPPPGQYTPKLSQCYQRQTYATAGVLFLQAHGLSHARTSRRTRRSSRRSRTCGASTGTRSAPWIPLAYARASSLTVRLGICSKNASPTCADAPLLMAVYTGLRSRRVSGCSPAWKRCVRGNTRTTLIPVGGPCDLRKRESLEAPLKLQVVRHHSLIPIDPAVYLFDNF